MTLQDLGNIGELAKSFIEYVDARIPNSSRRGTVLSDGILAPVWPDTGVRNPESGS